MSNRGGRPAKSELAGTKHVRVFADLAQMLTLIGEATGQSTAQFLDPLIRPHVETAYVTLHPALLALKAARDAARLAGGREASDPLPPLPAGAAGQSDKPRRGKRT